MKKWTERIKHKIGFTMAETMIVVAIMSIIMAVAVPEGVVTQRKLRQTELDAKAQTIYVAAQNVLSKLHVSGREQAYRYYDDQRNQVTKLADIPDDCIDPDVEPGDICAVSSAQLGIDGAAAAAIMGKDNIEEELADNHWVIEYNPSSALVYAVFYSEDLADCAAEYADSYAAYDTSLRYKDKRIEDGAKVGYYGGGNADSASSVNKITPKLNIINAEKLVAQVSCTVPSSITDYPVIKFSISDEAGQEYTKYYTYWASTAEYINKIRAIAGTDEVDHAVTSMTKKGRKYTVEVVLDDLSSEATRFVNAYGQGSSHTVKLASGTPLKVTVTAMCPGNYLVTQNFSDSAATNSLFADESTTEHAVISFGRHLQNLNENSGVSDQVQTAEQNSDILFSDVKTKTELYDWQETYHTGYYNGVKKEHPVFEPIRNKNLSCYDGKSSYRITDLYVSAQKEAGLFAVLYKGQTVKNVILTGSRITSSSGAAGAFAGAVVAEDGTAHLEHCLVYLTPADLADKTNHDIWIQGNAAGGLVGEARTGTVQIKQSGAATVIGNYAFDETAQTVTSYDCDSAGGLIGTQKAGSINVEDSYADCYLTAECAGGLIGSSSADVTLTNSYSAGFVTFSKEGAGLSLGTAAMQNCYTILCRNYMKNSDAAYYQTAKNGSVMGHVYYSMQNHHVEQPQEIGDESIGALDLKEMTVRLNENGTGAFKYDTSDTAGNAYNLMGQSLTTYTFPELCKVEQYGDWKADFQVGALVYYEKYKDASGDISYGFYGANVDATLKNDAKLTVVGDGYGIVYQNSDDNLPKHVTVTSEEQTYQLNITEEARLSYYVVNAQEQSYRIYPLPLEEVNKAQTKAQFFQKVKIVSNGEEENADYYYYNPQFAKTVVYLQDQNAAAPELTKDSTIAVRTARHLYMMSLYYDISADKTKEATYTQERNISYKVYDWAHFSNRSDKDQTPSDQSPISGNVVNGKTTSFLAHYDGQCNWIMDVSFTTKTGLYVGMFGKNSGDIENIVLRASYDEKTDHNFYVSRTGDIKSNQVVAIGILSGENEGYISNCAVAGYYIAGSDGTIHAYRNSTLYAGGLIGVNRGTVSNCSADTPSLRLSSTYASVYMAGLVGNNTNSITNSYALGHIEVVFARGGQVKISGFAGRNSGVIRNSYCATALTASGESTTSYGFSPAGGGIVNCTYLNNGSYSYVHHMYSFNFNEGVGKSVHLSDMQLKESDAERAVKSYDFANTDTLTNKYPFRAVVKNAKGELVHYGDWIDDVGLGSFGMFYWERETDGQNNGYHISYIAIAPEKEEKYIADTTLCTSHDDGGIIKEYGYGYFAKEEVIDTISANVSVKHIGGFDEAGKNAKASKDLEKQLPGYTFVAYNTKDVYDAASKGLYLDAPNADGTQYVQNGSMTLTYDQPYTFTFTPFFANAMQLDGFSGSVSDSAGNVTDYAKEPGDEANGYEIRSAAQLQYMNWNCKDKTALQLVDKNNYLNYTYLMATSKTSVAKQTLAEAKNNRITNWNQTHDLNAGAVTNFTPIAGQTIATQGGSYNAILYAWFGGNYDGQSYKISELNINSKSSTTGMFGVTAGGRIKNIILYSEKGAVIKRETTNEDAETSYTLGGLIGVAYRYEGQSDDAIENCAIAGYRIEDNSKNKQALGEANVGGLIGVANVSIERCSSVADIVINCTHKNKNGQNTLAQWGNFIRTGGITGACQYTMRDCYSGGSIRVGEETLDENYTSQNVHVDQNEEKQISGEKSTNIYIGGIGGSGFSMNYVNFTNSSDHNRQEVPKFVNCYTYMDFPDYEGTIRAIALIGSTADRYNYTNIQVTNSYYYEASAQIDVSKAPSFRLSAGGSVKSLIQTERYFKDMIEGNSKFVGKMMVNGERNRLMGTAPKSLTYEELSDEEMPEKLGTQWGKVTVTESAANINIDGKYSFPGSNLSLEGKNYPFPTVITQKDLIFGSYVNVHYGDWPVEGPKWENGRESIDIFEDMQADGYAFQTIKLYTNQKEIAPLRKEDIKLSDPQLAVVTAVGQKQTDNAGAYYPVTIRALAQGSLEVTAECVEGKGTEQEITYSPSFFLQITADLIVVSDPLECRLKVNEETQLSFYAVTRLNNDGSVAADARHFEESSQASWKLQAEKEDIVEVRKSVSGPHQFYVKHIDEEDVTLVASFTYDYHGIAITASSYVNISLQSYALKLQNGNTLIRQIDMSEDGIRQLAENVTVDSSTADLEFDGWYSSPDTEQATKVIDASGAIVAAWDGFSVPSEDAYVTKLTKDITLYAGFRKKTASGDPEP